jgi:SAM-dependent methyltransferase
MATYSDFAGGDQRYLRTVQYADSTKLGQRARLHVRYGTAPVPWFPWLVQQIEWPAGARVLEVGCGAGWLWDEGAPAVPADVVLTLTDLSPGMVGEAETRARAAGFRVWPCVVDVEALPWRGRRFDIAIAAFVLYHSADPVRAVAELARTVRPGGVVLAATSGDAHLRELWEIRAEVFGGAPVSETVVAFGVESGERMLAESFGSVAWRLYPDELVCTDPDDVIAFLTSSPPGEGADADQRARLRSAVGRRFDAGGGTLRVTKETGVFVCRDPVGQSVPPAASTR